MTNEQTPAPKRAVVPYKPPVDTSSMAIAGEAWKIASKIYDTEFVPKAMRGSPEAVLACIMTGHEVGISPMASLSKIHVVDGRPAMAAELMRALVLEHGHEIWIEEATNTRVIIKGSRAGSERVSAVTWTMDDANRAKLTGKHNWKSYPRAMLTARATTELCRMIFPDVLAGISHTVEELSDGEGELLEVLGAPEVVPGETSQDAAGASTPTRTHKAAHKATSGKGAGSPEHIQPPASAGSGDIPDLPGDEDIIEAEVIEAEPEVVEAEILEPEPPPAKPEPVNLPESEEDWPDDDDPPNEVEPGPTVTGPALIAIKLSEHGITDRDDRLGVVAQILEREVGTIKSSKDLSNEDIATVIHHLENLPEGIELWSPVPHEPEPEPEPRREVVTPVEEWDGDRWRSFLRKRKLKVAPTMRQAQALNHAEGREAITIASLDDLAGSGIEADLVGWCEDQ